MPSEHQKLQIMQKTALVPAKWQAPNHTAAFFKQDTSLIHMHTHATPQQTDHILFFNAQFVQHSLQPELYCYNTLSCFPTPYEPSITVRSGNGRVVLPSGCWWTAPGKPSGPAVLGGWGRGRSGAGVAAGWTLQHNISRCTVKGRCIMSKGSLLQSNVTTFKRANAIIKSRLKSKWPHQQWHHDAVKISR